MALSPIQISYLATTAIMYMRSEQNATLSSPWHMPLTTSLEVQCGAYSGHAACCLYMWH